jgi:DNA repair protein RecN (Recombination protein N)
VAERRDLLNYQINELAELAFGESELETLENDQTLLSHATWIMETVHGVAGQCADLGDQLRSSVNALTDERLGPKIEEGRDLIASSQIQLEEAASELTRYLDAIELDPQRLREVEARLDVAYTLSRKHRIQPAALAGHLQKLTDELEGLEQGDLSIERLAAVDKHLGLSAQKNSLKSGQWVQRDSQNARWNYWPSSLWIAVALKLALSILRPRVSTRVA